MGALIVASGELHGGPAVDELVRSRWDMVVCVDGGTSHAARLGIRPDVIIGDLDSAHGGALERFRSAGVKVLAYPPEKDKTDLDLAVEYVVAEGISSIVALAAVGDRIDHVLANILLTVKAASLGASLVLTDGRSEVRLVIGEAEVVGAPGDWVSLVAIGGDARGIYTDGLKYPLCDADLRMGETLAVSNELLDGRGRIRVRSGHVVMIHTRRADVRHI